MAKAKDKIQIRRDAAANWRQYNPTLSAGEYGLETDTMLIKIGNGSTEWNNLRYLNKLDSRYLIQNEDGSVTFTEEFENLLNSFIKSGDRVQTLLISNNPTLPEEVANKQYVDQAIAAISVLKRRVVNQLPSVENADENTIYLIKENNIYNEYMLIDNQLEKIGSGNTIIPVATSQSLGGVRASEDISISQDGFMTINRVSTSTLYVPNGDTFTIRGGNAN